MTTMQTRTSTAPTPETSLSNTKTGTASWRASSDAELRHNDIEPTQALSSDPSEEMASHRAYTEVADLRVEATT